jgi:hypothetical protein
LWGGLKRWLVLRIGRFELDHIAIADAHAVASITSSGLRYWPLRAYMLRPEVMVYFRVDLPRPVDIAAFESMPIRWAGFWRAWGSWLSGGRVPGHNCVWITTEALRAAGFDVPRRVTTPRLLFMHLRQRGCRLVQLYTAPDAPAGSETASGRQPIADRPA